MKLINTYVIYENPLPQLKSVHSFFPFLCELADGTILASHQMGEAFESVNATNFISKSCDGGKTWSAPVAMFDKASETQKTSDCCKITRIGEKTLIALGYEYFRDDESKPIGNPENGGVLDDRVFCSFSRDNGATWSLRQAIPCAWGPHVEASAPVSVLKDGSLATPITGFPDWEGNMSAALNGRLLRSFDGGKTWSDDVVCMDFHSDSITCYEQRLCQLENGMLVVIGWNEDTVSGKLLNNHFTISTDNGKTFSEPMDTGIHGQASSVCAIGGNRLLALHAMRKDTDTPGVLGCIVDLSDGTWNILEKKLLWAPQLPIVADKNMAGIFAFLKFGQPGAIMLSDGSILMSHWVCHEGQYKTLCSKIEL